MSFADRGRATLIAGSVCWKTGTDINLQVRKKEVRKRGMKHRILDAISCCRPSNLERAVKVIEVERYEIL